MAKEIQRSIESRIPPTPEILQAFYDTDPTPEIRAVLSAALAARVVVPDEVLLGYASKAMTDNQLWAMSMALRSGANPNVYIQSPDLGAPVHILVYVHETWKAKHPVATNADRLVMLVLVLVALGADPYRAAIDPLGGAVRSAAELSRPAGGPTVIEWLDKNRFPHVLHKVYPDVRKGTKPATLRQVALLSGRLNLLDGVKLTEEDALTIMKARTNDQLFVGRMESSTYKLPLQAGVGSSLGPSSSQTRGMGEDVKVSPDSGASTSSETRTVDAEPSSFDVATLLPAPREPLGLDYAVLYNAVVYYNDKLVIYYANRGLFLSYPMLNNIIIRIRDYQKSESPVLRDLFLSMLEASIANGVLIDNEQRSLLAGLPADIYRQLTQLYAKPYWQKICSHDNLYDDKVPERLLKIADEIGLEPQDHSSICYQLATMSSLSNEVLKETSRARQQARISAEHAYLSEFTGGKGPMLVCYNADDIDGDPFDVADLNLAHYRDIRGDLWCYTSDQFESLASSKVNPVTNEALPEALLDQMAYKEARLKELRRSPRTWRRFSDVIEETTRDDNFSNVESEHQLDQFLNYLVPLGVTKDMLGKLTNKDFDQACSTHGYKAQLSALTGYHALVTTAYIVNGFSVRDPTRSKNIAQAVARAARPSPPVMGPPRQVAVGLGVRQAEPRSGAGPSGMRR